MAQKREYPWRQDVAGSGNETGLRICWLLFKFSYPVTIQLHHAKLASFSPVTDVMDGDKRIVAVIGSNKLSQVKPKVVITGDD